MMAVSDPGMAFVAGFLAGIGIMFLLAYAYRTRIDVRRTGKVELYFNIVDRKAAFITAERDKVTLSFVMGDMVCSFDLTPSEFEDLKKALLELGPEVEERDGRVS